MRILGIIPARGGSKGVPRKNIKMLNGKPLIQYSWKSAKESELLSKTILSSEDQEILSVARDLGIEIPFVRPLELAQDVTPSIEIVRHALKYFEARKECFDAICLLQPTSPFRETGLIDKAIKRFVDGGYDSLISVRKMPDEFNPHWVFEEKNGSLQIATGESEIIARRQDLPTTYFRDGSIYITKTDIILDKNSFYGSKLGFIETSNPLHVNIDTPEDWLEAEELSKLYK